MHSIGVNYHLCDVVGCDYKAKQASSIKRHKGNVHAIGVTHHFCDVVGCDYKAKEKGNLKKHKTAVHAKPNPTTHSLRSSL